MRTGLIVAAAVVALSVVPTPARASGSDTLTIVTVPRLPRVRLALGDRMFATGRDGTARIAAAPGTYTLRLIDVDLRGGDVRSRFSRWGDNWFSAVRTVRVHGPTSLTVGFEQAARVSLAFVDRQGRAVDSRRVTKVTLSSTVGSRDSFRPDRARWLIAERVTRRFYGLAQTRVEYSVERAVVAGSNVVNKAQQRFFPAPGRLVRLQLLLYSARIDVRDLVFGFPIGKSIDLVYPDGSGTTLHLSGGQLRLSSLPRGTYGVKVHAWGYAPVFPLALSKDQTVTLRVVSYLDMVVIVAAIVLATLLLVLVRRPLLRTRLLTQLRQLPRFAAPAAGEGGE